MRNSIFAVCATLAIAGCGSSGPTKVDGGGDMTVVNDLTVVNQGDMTKPGPGCFKIIGGASSAKSPASSKMKADAFRACALAQCGSPQVVDGGNASKPCAQTVDGGASTACDQCFENIQVNDEITFTDPMTMMAIACKPDTTAPTCKACATEIVACVLDCNQDSDCDGLTTGGVQTTCVNNECQ
jgi:hypothetical protein